MKIMILEASKEELAANRRVADGIVDTLSTFLDSFARLNAFSNYNDDDNDDEEE